MVKLSILLTAAAFVIPAISHGTHHPSELQKRDAVWAASKRSLANCDASLKGRSLAERAIVRRSEMATKIQGKRGLQKRGLDSSGFLSSAIFFFQDIF